MVIWEDLNMSKWKGRTKQVIVNIGDGRWYIVDSVASMVD